MFPIAQNQLQNPFTLGSGKALTPPIAFPIKRLYSFTHLYAKALPLFLILGIAWPYNYRLYKIMSIEKENNKTSLC